MTIVKWNEMVRPMDFMHKLSSAFWNWRVEDFSAAAYGDLFNLEDVGRQGYLLGKFEDFKKNPVRFFGTLDLSNQRRFVKHINTIGLTAEV